jgi:redox-sensitive bicupin YhaK (pirin superfamily)
VSGPVTGQDTAPTPSGDAVTPTPVLEVLDARKSRVGALTVRRALPQRERRTVGAWCFVDHLGPTPPGADVGIAPHPHIGLQTATWLLAGELVHRDSLGSEQEIRAGQLNLMSAGRGVAHSEEATVARRRPALHGVQLWLAQPEATRHGPAAFEHHGELPALELAGDRGGRAAVTVFVGGLGGAVSPARRDTDLVGADLLLAGGRVEVPLDAAFEHALVVLDGAVDVDGTPVGPDRLAYLGLGRPSVALDAAAPSRVLLLGGRPFESPVLMWWNFVARTRAEIDEARTAWEAADRDRFPAVGSDLAPIPSPVPPWSPAS